MNAFQRFQIDHLSPSSLNLWRNSPGIWALNYLAKIKDEANPAFWRGQAVEDGLAALLRGTYLQEADVLAHRSFALNCAGETSNEIEAERNLITPMLACCATWKAPGELNATQLRVEYFFDPVPIPIIGYIDFAFDDGTDVDLKTTKACPSEPRMDHVRQISLYRAARKRNGGPLYVTTKRKEFYPVTDEMMSSALSDLEADALSLNNFLARCESRQDALKSLPVDWDNFRAPKVKVPLSEILTAG